MTIKEMCLCDYVELFICRNINCNEPAQYLIVASEEDILVDILIPRPLCRCHFEELRSLFEQSSINLKCVELWKYKKLEKLHDCVNLTSDTKG